MGFKDVEWAYTVPLKLAPSAILAAVCHRTDDKTHQTVVGQQTLADMLGCDRGTVLRSLGVLEELGIITRTPRNRRDGSKTSDTITVNVAWMTESNAAESNVAESNVAETHVAESHDLRGRKQQQEEAKASSLVNQRSPRESAARGTRIPDPFIVTLDMRSWAALEAPAVDVDHATRMFVDHFRAATGRNATKLDWPATWRNWLRRDQQTAAKRPQRINDHDRVATAAQIGARLAARPRELTA